MARVARQNGMKLTRLECHERVPYEDGYRTLYELRGESNGKSWSIRLFCDDISSTSGAHWLFLSALKSSLGRDIPELTRVDVPVIDLNQSPYSDMVEFLRVDRPPVKVVQIPTSKEDELMLQEVEKVNPALFKVQK